jgi:hypothetical protein
MEERWDKNKHKRKFVKDRSYKKNGQRSSTTRCQKEIYNHQRNTEMIKVGKAYKMRTGNIFYIAKHIEGNTYVHVTPIGWQIREFDEEYNFANLDMAAKHMILKASFVRWSPK